MMSFDLDKPVANGRPQRIDSTRSALLDESSPLALSAERGRGVGGSECQSIQTPLNHSQRHARPQHVDVIYTMPTLEDR